MVSQHKDAKYEKVLKGENRFSLRSLRLCGVVTLWEGVPETALLPP